MNLSGLKDSLLEIYSATKTGGKLVANFRGTYLYDETKMWGKVWKFFYSICPCFSNVKEKSLQKALLKTHELFKSHLPFIQEAIRKCDAHLESILSDHKQLDSKNIDEAKKIISDWNQATSVFLRMLNEKNQKQLKKEHPFIANVLGYFPKGVRPFYFEGYERGIQIQHLIDFEVVSKRFEIPALPVKILKQLKEGNSSFIDSELRHWIEFINKLEGSYIPTVHKALCAVFGHDAYLIEKKLEEKGCSLFSLDDPTHLRWKNSLQMGQEIEVFPDCPLQPLVLGERQSAPDSPIVSFNLAGQDNLVFSTGNNCTSLPILNEKRKELSHLPIANIIYVDPQGKFIISEKMVTLKAGLEKEPSVANKLVDFVKRLLQYILLNSDTPKIPYNPSFLKCNANGELKLSLLSVNQKEPYSLCYDDLEELVIEASLNYKTALKLMQATGLSNHPCGLYYGGVFKQGLKQKLTPEQFLRGREIVDKRLLENGKAIYNMAQKIKDELDKQLHANKVKFKEQELIDALSKVSDENPAGAFLVSKYSENYKEELLRNAGALIINSPSEEPSECIPF